MCSELRHAHDSLLTPYMTKLQVLTIFGRKGGYLTPDGILSQLRPVLDRRSLYSYLARLQGQGLLVRHPNSRRGQLAYRLTERGLARAEYLHRKLVAGES
jgi:hypothetical protein